MISLHILSYLGSTSLQFAWFIHIHCQDYRLQFVCPSQFFSPQFFFLFRAAFFVAFFTSGILTGLAPWAVFFLFGFARIVHNSVAFVILRMMETESMLFLSQFLYVVFQLNYGNFCTSFGCKYSCPDHSYACTGRATNYLTIGCFSFTDLRVK